MMFCTQCGYKNADNAKFCSQCGSSMEPASTAEIPKREDVETKKQPENNTKREEKLLATSSYASKLRCDEAEVIQKIRDGELNGRLINGEWMVVLGHYNPSASVTEARGPTQTDGEYQRDPYLGTNNSRGGFDKFIKGDYGLATTFWGFGVLVSVITRLFAQFISDVGLLSTLTIGMLIYNIMWIIAIFRAASKYEGLVIWAYLARIMAILPWLLMFAAIIIPAMQ